jgi:predicted P-loop ATPase
LQRYENGEPWWLDTDELNRLAADEQEQRYEPGVWDDMILTWLESPTQRSEWDGVAKHELPVTRFNSNRDAVTITDVLIHAVGKAIENCTQRDRKQVARCLTHAGWNETRQRVGKSNIRFYERPKR